MNQTSGYASLKNLTLILYILYLAAILTAGLLAVVALIINYLKRNEVRQTLLESHFDWQIRTFWWYLLWNIIAFAPFIFVLFAGQHSNAFAGLALSSTTFCLIVIGLSWFWVIYRVIRGLMALTDDKPMY